MEDPQLYHNGNKLQQRDASEMIPKYIGLVQWRNTDILNVLDIGCGNGDVTWKCLRPHLPKGTKIVGVDIEQKMLEYAKEHYPEIQYFQMDISSAEIPKYLYGAYDNIFSFYCLHYAQEQKQALENIYNMLKPGGCLFTYYIVSHVFFDACYRSALLKNWKNYIHGAEKYMAVFQHKCQTATKQYLNDVLNNIGWKIILCDIVEKEYVYKNYDDLRECITAVHPHYSKIPHNSRTHFIDDTIEEFYKLMPEKKSHSDKITVKYYTVVVVATKPKI